MNTVTTTAELPPSELCAGPDRTGSELKRGMFFNTIALLASNFRGVFTFLIARLLGAASLGVFLVAWATTDILSKIGMFGLDNAIIPFIARSEVAGERGRSRALFHLAVFLAVAQSALVASLAILIVRLAGNRFGLDPQMVEVLSVLLCAMPGVNLYRICTAVSRAMKVMKHDIWSRGMTEPIVTTLAFLGAVTLGWKTFGAPIAAIIGTGASGIVALILASSLFRTAPSTRGIISYRAEARASAGLLRLDQRLRSDQRFDPQTGCDHARMFCWARPRGDAIDGWHLRGGRGSGERFAQGQPCFQSYLRSADCRHDG